MTCKQFTENTLKFTGKNHLKDAWNLLKKKRKEGQWWEFASTCTDRSIIMRRKGRE